MIIHGSYITGPACLRQLFLMSPIEELLLDFWNQRNSFKRDLSPASVFYWNLETVRYYDEICSLIDKFEEHNSLSKEDIVSFATILGLFVDITLSPSIVEKILLESQSNTEQLILYVNRSVFDLGRVSIHTKKTCLRKIEVTNNGSSRITLFGSEYEVPAGQCLYAVASNGRFVLVLPREIECHFFKLTLINHPGVFASDLKKTGKATGYIDEVFNNIVSFAIINGKEMIRIDNNGGVDGDGAYLLSAAGGYPAIYTISDNKNNNGIVLYNRGNGASDCLLKTTMHGVKPTASYAGFNIHGHLIGLNDE